MTTTIPVGGDYDVLIGRELPVTVPGADQVAVIHSAPLAEHAHRIAASLGGARPLLIEVPDAEAGKTVATAEKCWAALAEAGFTRTDAVVGVGGGAVTDLAGFVAASWLRGVRVVQVPTSLLGMVDAAVGGKTGVNIAAGKNMVGAFHPPSQVVCDLSTLDTLPAPELVNGMAEIVKCGFIADPVILDLAAADWKAHLPELIERSIQVKVDVVVDDLRDTGRREFLNYGHTLGHAIEHLEHYRWRHGHAVSVGLVFAAELARLTGRLDESTAARHRTALAQVGLPVQYRKESWADLRAAMRIDKKARGSALRFVVLDGLAQPAILTGPAEDVLEEAFQAVAA
ncbi:3-dehydroquinate synthase [Longispora albida]|uniref:3-dehydroquinate synthase n=1 Tax=Longispora albida TaxID=203523 RepID=UPI000374091D|nr:3-dehydroquinate synthase [Longispora albida]